MLLRRLSGIAVLLMPVLGASSPRLIISTSTPLVWHSDDSRNWAGYAAGGGSFTGVTATWTIPQSSGSGVDATWVGIGGLQTRDLIQAGTQGTVTRSGSVTH